MVSSPSCLGKPLVFLLSLLKGCTLGQDKLRSHTWMNVDEDIHMQEPFEDRKLPVRVPTWTPCVGF